MKTQLKLAALLLLATCHLQPSSLLAQGSLTPPGVPAPTMKTLAQIEPRIPISGGGINIIAPGSYYLTTNLTGGAGIAISADNVTLDLNGFVLDSGSVGNTVGISCGPSIKNSTIRRGTLVNWGGGVSCLGTGCVLEDIHVVNCHGTGIETGPGATISRCTVLANQTGIASGLDCLITGCTALANTNTGIFADNGSSVRNCVSQGNGNGILTGTAVTVEDCAARQNLGDGILVASQCVLLRNHAVSNTVSGLHLQNNDNRCENNQSLGNNYGLNVTGTGNVIANNVVKNNTNNFLLAAGNQISLLLCQLPETISVPATVVLAGSLTGVSGQSGIAITADDVTIDLAGHSLIGVPGSFAGISASGRTNLVVRNGTLRDWGGSGVDLGNCANCLFKDLRLTRNGGAGLLGGGGSIMANCTASANGSTGLALGDASVIRDCSAVTNQGPGFNVGNGCVLIGCAAKTNNVQGFSGRDGCTFKDCSALGNANDGFSVLIGGTILGCTAKSNGHYGIDAGDATTIRQCTCRQNGYGGIAVTYSSFVVDNLCDLNGGTGIRAFNFHNRIESNLVTGNGGNGIQVDAGSNWIIKNSARNNSGGGGNYGGIAVGNDVGPIGTAATATSPWANLSL